MFKRKIYLCISSLLAVSVVFSACNDSVKQNVVETQTSPKGNVTAVEFIEPNETSAPKDTSKPKETVASKEKETISPSSNTQKITSANSISYGAKKMREIAESYKNYAINKDVNNMAKKANELEEVWSKLEDSVKVKSKELYEQAEKPLGAIKASVKLKSTDEKAIIKYLSDLEKVMEKIENLK